MFYKYRCIFPRGIHVLSQDAPVIEAFLCAVPSLCQQPETFGLIWDQVSK